MYICHIFIIHLSVDGHGPFPCLAQFGSVQSLSRVWLFGTRPSTTPACSNSCPSSQWCYPTDSSFVIPLFSYLQSFSASRSLQMSQFFASSSQKISFSFSFSPSSEYSGVISFRMEWLDLLAVQGTLRSLQHHRSKASILWCSASIIVQLLSHPCMTTGNAMPVQV